LLGASEAWSVLALAWTLHGRPRAIPTASACRSAPRRLRGRRRNCWRTSPSRPSPSRREERSGASVGSDRQRRGQLVRSVVSVLTNSHEIESTGRRFTRTLSLRTRTTLTKLHTHTPHTSTIRVPSAPSARSARSSHFATHAPSAHPSHTRCTRTLRSAYAAPAALTQSAYRSTHSERVRMHHRSHYA
jgi:hypothetical protein